LALDIGAKKGKFMNKKINKAIKGTFGEMREVKDFLPSPEELVLKKSEKVKVTLTLDKKSLDFFKKEAKKHNSPYQRMIRNLINEYAAKHNTL
jgi:predicted DNA binding CopG/RHH family protein